MILKLVVVLLLSAAGFAQNVHWCSLEAPLQVPSHLPLQVSDFSFDTKNDVTSGLVTARSSDVRPIKALLMVIELSDNQGQHVLSVPVYFYKSRNEWPFQFDDADWVRAHGLTDGKLEGKGTRLAFASPIIPPRCPSTAKVVFTEIVFGDGTSQEIGTRDFAKDPPILVRAQETKVALTAPALIRCTVTVSGHGRPTSVLFEVGTDVGAAELLEGEIKANLRFSQSNSEHRVPLVIVISDKHDLAYPLREEDVARGVKVVEDMTNRDFGIEIVGIRRNADNDAWVVRWSTDNLLIQGLVR